MEKRGGDMTSKEIEELAGHRQVPAWVVKLVGDAVAIEREACAKLLTEEVARFVLNSTNGKEAVHYCAYMIRERGQA
jgi:hypothetical protein